jgi:hypothetical protein
MEKYGRKLNAMPGRQETVFLYLLNLSQVPSQPLTGTYSTSRRHLLNFS